MTQNYRRLGLVSKLGKFTGGTERSVQNPNAAEPTASSLLKLPSVGETVVRETKVERDASGRIVRVVDTRRDNPLNDPLAHLDSDSDKEEEQEDEWEGIGDDDGRPEVIKELERVARMPVIKKPRHQSEQEKEWVKSLVEKYGDDYGAMVRDRRLNPMQQTEADIRKRIWKWQAGNG
jgi:nucleolar protein 16